MLPPTMSTPSLSIASTMSWGRRSRLNPSTSRAMRAAPPSERVASTSIPLAAGTDPAGRGSAIGEPAEP